MAVRPRPRGVQTFPSQGAKRRGEPPLQSESRLASNRVREVVLRQELEETRVPSSSREQGRGSDASELERVLLRCDVHAVKESVEIAERVVDESHRGVAPRAPLVPGLIELRD